jgi:hypothetical protein
MIEPDTYQFDARNIVWRSIPWLDHVSYFVYHADEVSGIVDVIFKIAANQRAMLHRHKAPYITLVIEGELRLYHANGELKEIRPVGSYVMSVANGEPHTEGGGDRDAIVFFSNRNVDGVLYEFLDAEGRIVQTLSLADFKAEFDAQVEAGSVARLAPYTLQ